MSTPEGSGPGEILLVSNSPSGLSQGITPPAASPGGSASAARFPTAPTLPDADIASLTLAVSRVAAELFGGQGVQQSPHGEVAERNPSQATVPAPSPAPAPAHPTNQVGAGVPLSSAGPSTPSSGEGPAAAEPPLQPGNPFLAEPDFSGLRFDDAGPAVAADVFTIPLRDLDGTDPALHGPGPRGRAGEGQGLREEHDPLQSRDAQHAGHQRDSLLPGHDPSVPAPSAHEAARPLHTVTAPWEVDPSVDLDLPSRGGFDAHAIRREFPILEERVHGRRLVWLDNAATTQKPRAVIERLKYFYEHENSNIHRAAHALAARATDAFEDARESVRRFVNASSVRDVVFVRGTTEGINLVAQSWGRRNVEAGDEIVVTHLEHHANIVPWQMLAAETGARLRVAPVDSRGQVLLDEYEKLLGDRTKLVAFTHVSNALGTVTPAREMIEIARRRGIRTLLDGAQSVSHLRVDLQSLAPDFFVFSGHKVFAPTGIGAVVAPAELLDAMPPWQGGGNMIQDVTFERTTYQPAPARFEAGTGNIADAVGLGAALDWLQRVGLENVARHEHDLLQYGTKRLLEVPGLAIIGNAPGKAGVLSFVLAGHDTHSVSTFLDREGIAVRGGHHCAQPILRRYGLQSTVRASLALYNTTEDLDALVAALFKLAGAH